MYIIYIYVCNIETSVIIHIKKAMTIERPEYLEDGNLYIINIYLLYINVTS